MLLTENQSEDEVSSLSHSDTKKRRIKRRQRHSFNEETDDGKPLLSFFIPDLTAGGAEQAAVNIVNGLSERGYNVELLLSKFEGELQSRLLSQVEVITLSPSSTSVLGVAAHFPAIIAYLRRRNPEVLFPHLAHPAVVCLISKRVAGVDTRIIPTYHSTFGISTDQTTKDRIVEWLVPHLYPSADRIIAVSEGVADSLTKRIDLNRDDISVLYNPVNIQMIQHLATEPADHEWFENDDVDVILFAGRLAHEKDLETWLRAFKFAHVQNSDTRAVIVGEGPERKKVSALAEKLGIREVVYMPGYANNPYKYMQRASVFLLSSRREGLPTVLIEALACGCSVVSTDCPSGPREILADGSYGCLVPVGDSVEIANAIDETLARPVSPEKLRKRADEFSSESVLDDYEGFLEQYITQS